MVRQDPSDEIVLLGIAGAGDFEGYVSFGLGLISRTGFRISTMTNPDRLVVDVRIASLPGTGTSPIWIMGLAACVLVSGVGLLPSPARRPDRRGGS